MELRLSGRRVFGGTGGRAWAADRPGLVLLHGAGMDHTVWAMQARAFAHRGRNVLALDLPGHGGSDGPALDGIETMADWVLEVAGACGLATFRLAGHSMGSLVAIEAAGRSGGRVTALALVGFAPEMRVHPDLLAAARAGSHAAIEMMVSWSLGMAGMLGANPAPGLSCAGAAMRLLERAEPASLVADLSACDRYAGAAQAAARVGCTTLLLLGGEDRMTPAASALAFAPRLTDSTVRILRGVGHLLPIEAPGPTLAALGDVL